MRFALLGLVLLGCSSSSPAATSSAQAAESGCPPRAGAYVSHFARLSGDCTTPAGASETFDKPTPSSECSVQQYAPSADGCDLVIEETCSFPAAAGAVHYVETTHEDADGGIAGTYDVDLRGTDHDCMGRFALTYTR